ncbi:beta-ketoacyl-ACP synthase III [Melissococcus plutonius]|uniref:beta-ketoacyl-ACP synthase III n=1 Tax=Melissococcus plutonius TaxID=33970 RepID=UPI00065E7DF3|nr:beta-ketoacyl-ACP synthase III [Melissococcus plutonius]AIM24621.1 3-oxoacyl-(acyl-carrier-protein) synthase 3 [Melissococcus plutonius S1]KMT24711.1 3-oxoacyl-(acyl-carrier-protein) synthase 3 [Melissococcus plutonius]KMT26348.1 3-oxoacyl-(acyl-carrier-protein) synthase 3 [Melissococcus plutonius]KMT27598.1 3-oxoacyl-(acyl-carrier-protein) synthase 3 [Melissococcus plutonius]KMT29371.1 3-oxoacyl-(acyl-carrier-protein) synthase 3 [Melissococcus plutonius]
MKQYTKIECTSRYVPDNIITNQQLSEIMDTSDEWIYSRTGIKTRHIVTEENTSDLCIQVAKQLLEKASLQAEAIDFIIVATVTPDYGMPSVACQVQGAVGADFAFAFDVGAACSGFVYALTLADKLIQSGAYHTGMVIGGETFSKILDWQDRSTAVLFGDGAAGVLVKASDEKYFIKEKLQADGTRYRSLTAGYTNNESMFYKNNNDVSAHLKMNGREIFDFVITDVVKNIKDLLEDEEIDTIDYFLLHQANVRLIDKVARKTKLPREKFLTNVASYGNTSAASIPILLDEAIEEKKISLGTQQKVMLTGFGGGLTYGSILLTL